tara:strand:+ start:452 stop:703 length:252 start_codon:yes stop_codon:yes gene_type:complete
MRTIRKNLTSFVNLTEDQKDDILNYIKEKEVSIKNAALNFNVTHETVNKIFTERFGKRTTPKELVATPRKQYYKEYWMENKHK